MKIKCICLALVVASAFPAAASDLDAAARSIAERNPELAASRARYEAEISAVRADNVLPGLEVDFDYKFGKHENRWGGSVSQPFDWPGLYSARRRAANVRRAAFEQLYRADYLEQALAAKQLLLDYIRAKSIVDVLAEAQANVDCLEKLYDYAFERGETTILEVRKLSLQAFALSTRRAEAEAELESVVASLRALNGGEDVNVALGIGFSIEVLEAENLYIDQLVANDPTVAAESSLLSAADNEIALAKQSAFPSFNIGYAYENEGGESFHGFAVGIALPTWSNSARVASSRAERLAVELGAKDYALRLRAQLSADYAAATRLGVRLDAGRNTFGADEYPQLLRKALDGGRINIFDYLREYNEYLDAKSEFIELEYQYASVVARLNRYSLLK